MSGSTLLPVAGRWSTMITAASTLGSRPDAILTSASTPPADAPMTTTGGSGGSGAGCTVRWSYATYHRTCHFSYRDEEKRFSAALRASRHYAQRIATLTPAL